MAHLYIKYIYIKIKNRKINNQYFYVVSVELFKLLKCECFLVFL